MNTWFEISNKKHGTGAGTGAGPAVIHIFDEIGAFGVTAEQFALQLKNLGDITAIELHINSPGGSVFDGLAIYNLLTRHEAAVTVFIDGLAASIASVIAMSGDEVIMPENALMMMHRPTALAFGDADRMLKKAEILQKTEPGIIAAYRNKTGLADSVISDMLAAETWLTAAEAVEQGFADRIEEPLKIAAHFDLDQFNHVPDHYRKEKAAMPDPKKKTESTTENETGAPVPAQGMTLLTPESPVANLAELQSALPKAGADFYVSCLEKDMTVAQAKDTWMDRLTAQNQAQAKEIELAKARTKKEVPGVDGLDHTSGNAKNPDAVGGCAVEQFNSAVREKVAAGSTRERAVAAVTNENSELHKAFLLETNPGKRRRRLIEERFDDE